ncbi:MAG: hypothetical protein ABJ314_16260, partial [Ilumatobacter sp.]
MLASLLVIAAVLVGVESGAAGSSAPPLSSPVLLDAMSEHKVEHEVDDSTCPRVSRRPTVRSIDRDVEALPRLLRAVGCGPARWLFH